MIPALIGSPTSLHQLSHTSLTLDTIDPPEGTPLLVNSNAPSTMSKLATCLWTHGHTREKEEITTGFQQKTQVNPKHMSMLLKKIPCRWAFF
jgi:hypothetical protein